MENPIQIQGNATLISYAILCSISIVASWCNLVHPPAALRRDLTGRLDRFHVLGIKVTLVAMKEKTPLHGLLPAIRVAGEDLDKCWEILRTEKTQFARRNWARAYFAWIEVICFMARQYVLSRRFKKRVIRRGDIPEYSLLRERRYRIDKGEASDEPAHGRTLDYIEFSLVTFAKAFGLRLKVRGGKSWEACASCLEGA